MPTLEFKGKQFVHAHHLSVPFRQLETDKPKSFPKGNASLDDNLIIHGDNLHALKALLPTYAGKVDCIYIDPPYNTGEEGWCYNDKVRGPLIQEWLKKSANPVDKDDLERHDKWLCMMWPRLKLLHELLHDEGVIFISIDENEEHHLRLALDEIFGELNFVEKITWNKRIPKNDKGIGNIHEYVLIYVKNCNYKHRFTMPKDGLDEVFDQATIFKRRNRPLDEAEIELKKFYEKKGYDRGITLYNGFDKNYKLWGKINVGWPNSKNGPRYDVPHPVSGKPVNVPDNGWRWKRETFWKNADFDPKRKKYRKIIKRYDGSYICGSIWFAKDEKTQPSFIQYLENVKDLLLRSIISLKSSGGMELAEILPNVEFPHPKTVKLIKRLINSTGKNSGLFLDSFAGSGPTAQAVLESNQEDGGRRKFILVECEDYSDKITAERVRRIIKGVPNARNEALKEGLGGSFTFCTLGDEVNIESLLKGEKLPDYESLARYVFYTATGKTLEKVAKPKTDYFIGETEVYRVHLIYKPDKNFLRTNKSALNAEMADRIAASNKHGKRCLVFATAKFMGQRELTKKKIDFCQLPYAIHRVLGD